MLTKKSLPIAAALILVIALASLGVAYGLWSDSLTVDGTVSLGTLDVNFIPAGPITEQDPLGVGACSLAYGDDIATITVTGAYPGYQCNIPLKVRNDGSIPAFGGMAFTGYEPVTGVSIGGSAIAPALLTPGTIIGQDLVIEVWDTPPMGGMYAFSYALLFTQP